jgi:hypothetical protein
MSELRRRGGVFRNSTEELLGRFAPELTQRGPTGNPRSISARDLTFGGRDLLTPEDQAALADVRSLTQTGVTRGQQRSLQQLEAGAAGAGLLGGAVESAISSRRSAFIQENQARSAERLRETVGGRLKGIGGSVGKFFGTVGQLSTLFDAGRHESVLDPTQGRGFSPIAGPLLQSLEALGMGAAAQSGFAKATGINLVNAPELNPEQAAIATNVAQFLNPSFSHEEQLSTNDRITRAVRGRGSIGGQRIAARLRSEQIGGRRVEAGQGLVEQIGRSFFGASAEAGRFGAESQALGLLTGAGQQARLGADQFSNLFRTLGIT